MAFTKVVGAGIHTLSNIASHNINSSGIITATKFVGPIEGNITAVDGVFSGNVSIAKTLTYEDVKNVDSVGVGTFREGVFIPDNKKLEIGNASGSGDLQLYHSPSDNNNSFIKHQSTGALKIAADHFRFRNKNDNSNILNGLSGGAVTLYFNNAEKLKTISDGIEIPDAIRHINDTNTAIRFPADDTISFETSGNEKVRIDSEGRILSRHSASRTVGTKTGQLQVIESGNNAAISIIQTNNAASAPFLCFGKTRSANDTGSTIVQNGDSLGQILFAGADGSDVDSTAALITAKVDGTPGSNDMPGKLVFATTADGASTATPAMEISSVGIVTCRNVPSFLISIDSLTDTGNNAIIISENNGFTLSATSRNSHNFGNHFNEADGKFTAPVEGLYFFGYSIMRSSTSGSGGVDIRIMKNGGVNSLYSRNYQGSYQVNFQAEGNTTIVRLKKDDYIQFRIGANMSVHNDDSYFYGYLIV